MVYTLISDGPLAPNLGPPTGRGRVGAVAAQAIDGSMDRRIGGSKNGGALNV